MNVLSSFLTTRWAVRAPIPMFKFGMGFVFGGQMLMLEHRGRKSGQSRFVVLEVVERESKNSVIVASGLGSKAHWYRNLQAEAVCFVSIGLRRRVQSRAELLGPDESNDYLRSYRQAHPMRWRSLQSALVQATGDTTPNIPMVRLVLDA